MFLNDLDISVRCSGDDIQISVYYKDGPYYWVNFSKDKPYVKCFNLENEVCAEYGLTEPNISISFPRTKKEVYLHEHPKFKGVKTYLFGEFDFLANGKKIKIIVEYLDTTYGNVPLHDHEGSVREAYLSMMHPYAGTMCSYGEKHKPFIKKTLSIKVVEHDK